MSAAVRPLTAALALLIAAPLLSGCATEARPDGGANPAAEGTAEAATDAVISIDGAWAKSADASGMTGLFGTIRNAGSEDLVIASVTSAVAERVELHEVTSDGVMQPLTGDARIPAGGSFELAPGANHIMLMGLREALLPGTEVAFTLVFTDGTSVDMTAAVKDYSGANEEYADHGGTDHGATDDHAADHGGDAGDDEHAAH